MTARLGCVGGWAMITLAIVAGGAGMAQGATYPRGFRETPIAAGLALPTAFAFFPDGRIVIAEKAGVVRMVKDGRLLSTPFVDVSDRVNDYWDRGLLGIAVDPNQAANPYVYLLYTFENDPGDYSGPKTARLTRLRVQGDRANPDSEVVLVGKVVGRSCDDFPAGADCIPSDAPSHTVGAVRFAGDTLFVTTGDGASFNTVTDQEVVARSREGDESAYRELIRRYERPVFSLIFRMVRDREIAGLKDEVGRMRDLMENVRSGVERLERRVRTEAKREADAELQEWVEALGSRSAVDAEAVLRELGELEAMLGVLEGD